MGLVTNWFEISSAHELGLLDLFAHASELFAKTISRVSINFRARIRIILQQSPMFLSSLGHVLQL